MKQDKVSFHFGIYLIQVVVVHLFKRQWRSQINTKNKKSVLPTKPLHCVRPYKLFHIKQLLDYSGCEFLDWLPIKGVTTLTTSLYQSWGGFRIKIMINSSKLSGGNCTETMSERYDKRHWITQTHS